jgi:hypothetical protein
MAKLTPFPANHSFSEHVAFDNLPVGEATKNNTSAFTLNFKHKAYRSGRRSRTFMVGVDEHAYSDYALAWMMEQLVDDGDEVICVRVVETQVRAAEKFYQTDARKTMDAIQEKNLHDRAISIVLEYAVGKLHATFQQFVSSIKYRNGESIKLVGVLIRIFRSKYTSHPCSLSAHEADPLAGFKDSSTRGTHSQSTVCSTRQYPSSLCGRMRSAERRLKRGSMIPDDRAT